MTTENNLHEKIAPTAPKSIKAKANKKRTKTDKFADWMTEVFGSITFLAVNVVVFIVWILINTGSIPGVTPFDEFPFNFLTLTVSLEAIILAIFVLISQNRSLQVDDLREELHLQVNLIAEEEVTEILKLLTVLLEKQGINATTNPELKKLLKPINKEEIEKNLEHEITEK